MKSEFWLPICLKIYDPHSPTPRIIYFRPTRRWVEKNLTPHLNPKCTRPRPSLPPPPPPPPPPPTPHTHTPDYKWLVLYSFIACALYFKDTVYKLIVGLLAWPVFSYKFCNLKRICCHTGLVWNLGVDTLSETNYMQIKWQEIVQNDWSNFRLMETLLAVSDGFVF